MIRHITKGGNISCSQNLGVHFNCRPANPESLALAAEQRLAAIFQGDDTAIPVESAPKDEVNGQVLDVPIEIFHRLEDSGQTVDGDDAPPWEVAA